MKNLFYFLLSATLIFTSACGKDDDCVAGSLESVIVGEWRVTSNGIHDGDVEFQSDGTYIDQDEALVFNPNQTDMEYFVDSPSQIRIRVHLITPADYIVQIQDFDCDEIHLSSVGLDYTLQRK